MTLSIEDLYTVSDPDGGSGVFVLKCLVLKTELMRRRYWNDLKECHQQIIINNQTITAACPDQSILVNKKYPNDIIRF